MITFNSSYEYFKRAFAHKNVPLQLMVLCLKLLGSLHIKSLDYFSLRDFHKHLTLLNIKNVSMFENMILVPL